MAEVEYRSTTDDAGSEDSSQNGSVLSFRFSSFPFENYSSSSDSNEDSHRVEPYLYEPEQSSSDEADEPSDDDARSERLGNTDW